MIVIELFIMSLEKLLVSIDENCIFIIWELIESIEF